MSNRVRFGKGSYTDVYFEGTTMVFDAFYGATTVTEVELTDITTLPGAAFMYSQALESIKLPKIEEIGDQAFQGICTNLKNFEAGSTTHPVIYGDAGYQLDNFLDVAKKLEKFTIYLTEEDDELEDFIDWIKSLVDNQTDPSKVQVRIIIDDDTYTLVRWQLQKLEEA